MKIAAKTAWNTEVTIAARILPKILATIAGKIEFKIATPKILENINAKFG